MDMDKKSFEDIKTVDELNDWFDSKDAELERYSDAHVVTGPCCFGGVYRIDDAGTYVSAERFQDILPTDAEQSTWLCMANGENAEDLIGHLGDTERLRQEASDLIEEDGPCFYTELYVTDYSQEEIEELKEDRPELFDANGEAIYGDPAFDSDSNSTPENTPESLDSICEALTADGVSTADKQEYSDPER